MKKIIFISDITRSVFFTESKSDKKFYYLLKSQIESAVEAKIATLENLGFDYKLFFKLNNIEIKSFDLLSFEESNDAWYKFFKAGNFTKEAKEYLNSFFKDSFIISYHTSRLVINFFQEYNIKYIDIFEGTHRFIEDSSCAIRTNCETIRSYLFSHKISSVKMEAQANYLKAYSLLSPLNLEENSAFLSLQTEVDYVLIKEGGILDSIFNYEEQIRDIANRHSILYYKQHPYSDDKYKEKIRFFLGKIKNVKEIDYGMYEILSNQNIKSVIGINSGSLYEAEYFDKEVIFLGEKAIEYSEHNQKLEEIDNKTFIILSSSKLLFSLKFWQELLKDEFILKSYENLDIQLFENPFLLREVLNISSSYPFRFFSLKTQNEIQQLNHLNSKLKKYRKKIVILLGIIFIMIIVSIFLSFF